MSRRSKIKDALSILSDLEMPPAQRNERSALCLLAILDMTPNCEWADARNPLIGITPIMEWARDNYRQEWAPNTRETIRRQTMHQFMAAGVALYNPDKPDRPVNSPAAVYQIEPTLRDVLRSYGSDRYQQLLAGYKRVRQSLMEQYAAEREMNLVPVQLMDGAEIKLSPALTPNSSKRLLKHSQPASFLPESWSMSETRATSTVTTTSSY